MPNRRREEKLAGESREREREREREKIGMRDTVSFGYPFNLSQIDSTPMNIKVMPLTNV